MMRFITLTTVFLSLTLYSGCWWGERVNREEKEQQELLNAEIYEKYRRENIKRAKKNQPPLPLPKHKQIPKRFLWY